MAGAAAGQDEPGHASELTLYSMMALVNLSYCNERVQELVRACGGVPLIQQQLSSPLYEARKTAAFCLGNLVRDNGANAADVVLHGGVEALKRSLDDEDDDELSKTAYSTVQHLGLAGVQQLLRVIASAGQVLLGRGNAMGGMMGGGMGPGGSFTRRGGAGGGMLSDHAEVDEEDWEEEMSLDEVGRGGQPGRPKPSTRPQSAIASGGGSLFASRAAPSRSSAAATSTAAAALAPSAAVSAPLAAVSIHSQSPEQAASVAALDMLGVALPVLNGMAYTADSHGKAVLTVEGLGALLPLYSEEVPAELHEQATHVLFNCTSIKEDPSRLALAVRRRRRGHVHGRADRPRGRRPRRPRSRIRYADHLAEGRADGRDRFAHNRAAMDLLLGLCDRTPVGSNDVRVAAAELLLALISCERTHRHASACSGRRQARAEAIASASWSGDVLSARAKQAIRELSWGVFIYGGKSAHSVMWTERDHRRWRRRDGETRRREVLVGRLVAALLVSV